MTPLPSKADSSKRIVSSRPRAEGDRARRMSIRLTTGWELMESNTLDLLLNIRFAVIRIEHQDLPQGRRALLPVIVDQRQIIQGQMADHLPGGLFAEHSRSWVWSDRPDSGSISTGAPVCNVKSRVADAKRHVQRQVTVGAQEIQAELLQAAAVRRFLGVNQDM